MPTGLDALSASTFFESVPDRHPELLAPVGDLAMARAAIAGGADAVYVGFPDFNARGRSARLSPADMAELITLCHRYGLRVYIALNVLIFENEFEALVRPLTEMLQLKPDAFIVQDVGLARWLAALQLRIHASTQMTVTDPDSLSFYARLPFARFILAREMSLDRIQHTVLRAKDLRRETECFIQGALCVSYSGQCLTSESFGGGSANRGRCAQSCRFLYDVFVDDRLHSANQYAVSARDLNASSMLGDLLSTGVDCFKIEGRLKEPSYVAASVRSYRRRMQSLSDDLNIDHAFSRRAFGGWLGGVDHQELVDPQIQTHVGEYVGTVERLVADGVVVRTDSAWPTDSPHRRHAEPTGRTPHIHHATGSEQSLIPGDGIAFVNADGFRTGGSLILIAAEASSARPVKRPLLKLQFHGLPNAHQIQVGARVFRNHSVYFERQARALLNGALPSVPVRIEAVAEVGQYLTVTYSDPEGRSVTVQSDTLCAEARKAPLTAARLSEELGALAGTAYSMESFSFVNQTPVFLHQREWKACRRAAVEALDSLRLQNAAPSANHIDTSDASDDSVGRALRRLRSENKKEATNEEKPARLHLLIRQPEHVLLLQPGDADSVTLDFEYGRLLQQSIDRLRDIGIRTGIATYRIMADGQDLKLIERLRPDIVLARNVGALHRLQGYTGEIIGDFSLNAANSLSARFFLSEGGLKRIVPSLDLNAGELFQMIDNCDGQRIEIILHQRIASFHMEYCLYARYLSDGSDFRTCNMPCKDHRLALSDPEGERHPVYTDFACRNTMYRSRPQSMAAHLAGLLRRSVHHYRIDLLNEEAEAVRHLLRRYQDVLAAPETGTSMIKEEGWSEGQLRRGERTIENRKAARR